MSVPTLKRNMKLKKAIKSSGQTQKAFAIRVGLSEITLSWHILGRWNLTGGEKIRVATELRKPIAALFN